MKILHLLDSTNRGGAEILALDFCRNAGKYGLDVTLVATGKGDLFDEFKHSGANFIFIERKMPVDFRLVYELKKIVNENGIRVIHGHQAVDGLHAYLTKLFTNVKTVMSFHGHNPSKKNDIVLKFLIPRMDANIAVSHSFLKSLEEELGFNTSKNFHIIYNGIDPKKFYKTDKNFRRELHLSDSDILMGMVGNFYNDVRDHMTVCSALPDIFKKYSNVHFAFVGRRGEQNPHFYDNCVSFCNEKKIIEKTHFVGARSDINNILNSLDLFIYSSNHDTFGIAVVEAMLSGLPVVANDIPAMMEITDNGKYARIFETKNSKSLFDEISFLINNNEARNAQAILGQKWASERYTITQHISNLNNLYEKIIHN